MTMQKGIYYGFLPGATVEEKFTQAAALGFACVEVPTLATAADRQQYRAAAAAAGICIPSVMNQAHWSAPLSDADPAVRAKSVEGMMASLATAEALGANTVLLVPAVVKPDVSYEQAWERSHEEISRMLPAYAEKRVAIAIENVWNRFLLSPIEFCHYVDSFSSPWLGAYFDVGNILAYGYPEHWIMSLGKRLKKVHIKGFDSGKHAWTSLLKGTVNWPAVMTAFRAVGYDGVITAELRGEGEDAAAQARNVSADMDTILAM